MQWLLGIALAGAAGWNALLPLLMLAFASRIGHRVTFAGPFAFLGSVAGLLVLLVLLPVEIILDKIPRLDARNDRLAAVYRPVAGAVVLLGAVQPETLLAGVLAAALGAATAFGMHLLKTRYRRPLVHVIAGMIVPLASLVEDFASALIAFVALLAAPAGVALLAAFAVGAWFVARPLLRNVPKTAQT